MRNIPLYSLAVLLLTSLPSNSFAEVRVEGSPIYSFQEVTGNWNNPYGRNIDLTIDPSGSFTAYISGEDDPKKQGIARIDAHGNLIFQAGGRITLRRKDTTTLCGKAEVRILFVPKEFYICFYRPKETLGGRP